MSSQAPTDTPDNAAANPAVDVLIAHLKTPNRVSAAQLSALFRARRDLAISPESLRSLALAGHIRFYAAARGIVFDIAEAAADLLAYRKERAQELRRRQLTMPRRRGAQRRRLAPVMRHQAA
jgi:hypothetical protein